MNKRGTGTIFCLIATMLFCTRYISAAIIESGNCNEQLFQYTLSYMGSPLLVLSIINLGIGIAYLIWSERSKEK